MGIFNNDNFFSSAGVPVIEGDQYDVELGGAANIAMESYEDHLSIIKAIHAADMVELGCRAKMRNLAEGYGSYDAEYELQSVQEASIKEIFNTIKEGIKKFFGKIADFFKKLYTNFVTMKKSNKSFAEKYKNVLADLKTYVKPVTVSGYNYHSLDRIVKMCDDGVSKIEEKLKDYNESIDKIVEALGNGDSKASDLAKDYIGSVTATANLNQKFLNEIVGPYANKSGMSTTEMLYLHYRNNKSDKEEISYTYDTIISALDTLEKLDPSILKKIDGKVSKGMDKALKTVNTAERGYNKLPSDNAAKPHLIKITQELTKLITNAKSTAMSSISVMRNITNDYSNQVKTATIKMIAIARDAKKAADKKK